MDNIVVGFSKPINRSWPFGYVFSWAIRIMENTEYSHAYIQWSSDWLERDIIYEASGSTVHFVVGHKFEKTAKTVFKYEIECSSEAKAKIIRKAMDYSNDPYGIKQVFGILIVRIARVFEKDIKNPFSDGNATWICSEIVMDLLEELGIDLSINQDNISPRDIQNFLENNKQSEKNTGSKIKSITV